LKILDFHSLVFVSITSSAIPPEGRQPLPKLVGHTEVGCGTNCYALFLSTVLKIYIATVSLFQELSSS